MFNHMVERHRDRLSDVFAAIADPTRRAIVQTLARKPATISQIARPFPVSFNAVSKHMMVLERAGLVHREIRGREHVCRLRRSEEHTSELQSHSDLVCRLLLEKKKTPNA